MTKERINTIISLDISTSAIGWSIIAPNERPEADPILIDSGTFVPKSKGSLYEKAEAFGKFLQDLRAKHHDCKVLGIIVESPKIAFGATTAKTIATLQRFNGIICWILFSSLGVEPHLLSETSARATLGIKKEKGTKHKILAGRWIVDQWWFAEDKVSRKRNGELKDHLLDETDAIVLGLAYLKANPNILR